MTVADAAVTAHGVQAPTFARLVKTEFRRLRLRRFTRVTLVASAIGLILASVWMWIAHARPSASDIASATAKRAQHIDDIRQRVQECLASGGNQCGFVPSPDSVSINQWLPYHPFNPELIGQFALPVAIGIAMAAFFIAASSIGAEWSSKNLVGTLFYEPRRLRLMGAKILALAGVLIPVAFIAQALWLLAGRLLVTYRGDTVSSLGDRATDFWQNLIGVQTRAALIVLPIALIAFALANLLRNTAAALGIAFVYLAIVETITNAVIPALQPHLLTNAIGAWVTHGGITIYTGNVVYSENSVQATHTTELSNLHGGIVLAATPSSC